ncbi:MAG TPA: hypothetical protein VGN26_04645 [Armatimonadota bacterium]
MFWGNRQAREAQETLEDVKPRLVSVLSDAGSEFQTVRFRAERVLEGELTAEDRRQLSEAVESTDANLDACRHALSVIQNYERTKDVPVNDFRHLKQQFLTQEDDPEDITFDSPHDAIQWIANRALEFAEYVRDTQLAWFRKSLGEAQDALDTETTETGEAEEARKQAQEMLEQAKQQMPQVRFTHAEQQMRELEDAWVEFQQLSRQKLHSDTAEMAQELGGLAQQVIDAVQETQEFVQDPQGKHLEAKEFLDELRTRLQQGGGGMPTEVGEAEEALTESRAEMQKPSPDLSEAARLYSRASTLAAQAVGYLPESLR